FQDDALLVDPAFLRGGFDHGVFAADVVGADGDVEFVADLANDVEIRKRGLDHDDVGAFFEIERDFLERFASVGGIHLVAAAIAELRSGLRGFAEWTVKAGAVFRGVGEDGDVFEFVGVELTADRGYAAVHHVRGRDDVGTGARVRQRLL